MNQNPMGKFLGLSGNELFMLWSLGGALVCVILGFVAYVLYTSGWAFPARASGTFPTLQPSSTAAQIYIPVASLTGWPLGTSAPTTPTLGPTGTPRPTSTPVPTSTPRPTRTPTATPSPTQPTPTATVQLGTFDNPVPVGSDFALPGLGTLTVTHSSWRPGQTGLAIVDLSFVCGQPIGSQCRTNKLILGALGDSGSGYERAFGPAIPGPAFGYDLNASLYAGGTEAGSAGFLVKNSESSLIMRVQIFLEEGQYFFWIGPVPQS